MKSQLALHEVANSYVNGNYMAVVLLAHAFIEHSLSGELIMRGQNAIAESSLKKIIDKSLSENVIDEELYVSLEALRKIRNPYVYAKAGIKSASLIKKMIDGHFELAEFLAKSEALESLSILKAFMEQKVVMWFPEDEA